MLLGAVDGHGHPWATLLAGPPGFVTTPDAATLRFAASVPEWDPLAGVLEAGVPVGLLGIELATRRRNRANGVVRAHGAGQLVVDVRQSFGNCPKYIVEREPRWRGPVEAVAVERFGSLLPPAAREQVRAADTFFIATASPPGVQDGGADVSHRGGAAGFVQVDEQDGRSMLQVPDYVGNSFFNTFGNIALNPRAGLLFADFVAGDLLLLTGHAEVLWEGQERLLRFQLESGVLARGGLPLRAASWLRRPLTRRGPHAV